jgi:hypothetical protein
LDNLIIKKVGTCNGSGGMENSLNDHHIAITTSNQQGRNVTSCEEDNYVEILDILFSCVKVPFVSDNLLHYSTVQIRNVLINISAKLGYKLLLIEHFHVYLKICLILWYMSQRTVEVFMKRQGFFHESLDVASDYILIKEPSRVCLTHEFEEPLENSGVRRLFRR